MFQNKKKIISIIVIITVLIMLILGIIGVWYYNTREIDLTGAIPGIVLEDNVNFNKIAKTENVRIHKQVDLGTHAYILETFKGKDGNNWSKVVIDNKVGYILSEQVGSYSASGKDMILMSDVSKFNKIYNFNTAEEFGAFLIKNDFDCVYIRAGGRGYGTKGNFYYDECYEMWAKECEYLKIPFGFYFLDEALNSEEIDEEVDFIEEFLEENIYEYNVLPVALDIEKHDGKGRADEIWAERAPLVSELIRKLKRRDIETIVYSNAKTASEFLGTVNTKFWLAYYPNLNGKIPDYWYTKTNQEPAQNEELMKKMIGWQFTETGVGNVIPDSVDVSLVYGEFLEKYIKD